MARQEDNTIIITFNGKEGLTQDFTGFPTHASPQPHLNTLGSENQYADGTVNPFRYPGFMGPANNDFETITHDDTAKIVSSVVDDVNRRAYIGDVKGAGASSRIFYLDDTDTSTTIRRTVPNAEEITNLAIYSLNGTRSLYYAYQASGGGDIGVYDNFSTPNDDLLSTDCAGDNFNTGTDSQVKMVPADNGFMYIMDENAVHKFDGTTDGGANGTATQNVLEFPGYFTITDAIDSQGLMWISVMGSTRNIRTTETVTTTDTFAGVYLWNRQSQRVNMSDFIFIPGIKDIRKLYFANGTINAITTSATNMAQVRQYDGSQFTVVQEFPEDSAPLLLDSFAQVDNLGYWLGKDDGHIYTYGTTPVGHNGLFRIGDLSGEVADGTSWSSGQAILFFGGAPTVTSGHNKTPETLIFCFADDTNFGEIRRWYPNALDVGTRAFNCHQGNYRSIMKALPKLSTMKGITVFFPKNNTPFGSADDIADVEIYTNRGTSAVKTYSINGDELNDGYVYIPYSEPKVNYVQLGLKYNTAVVVKQSIHPEYVIVDYMPKQKLK